MGEKRNRMIELYTQPLERNRLYTMLNRQLVECLLQDTELYKQLRGRMDTERHTQPPEHYLQKDIKIHVLCTRATKT